MLYRLTAPALALLFGATPAVAANAALDEVMTLCAAKRAEAKAVFAAAEADGWTMRPDCALPRTDDARVGGVLEMIDMMPCNLWRVKTAGGATRYLRVTEETADWPGGPYRLRSCAILGTRSSAQDLEAATSERLGAGPQPLEGAPTTWLWSESPSGRVFLPPVKDDADLVSATAKGPLYSFQFDKFEPEPDLVYSEVSRIGNSEP